MSCCLSRIPCWATFLAIGRGCVRSNRPPLQPGESPSLLLYGSSPGASNLSGPISVHGSPPATGKPLIVGASIAANESQSLPEVMDEAKAVAAFSSSPHPPARLRCHRIERRCSTSQRSVYPLRRPRLPRNSAPPACCWPNRQPMRRPQPQQRGGQTCRHSEILARQRPDSQPPSPRRAAGRLLRLLNRQKGRRLEPWHGRHRQRPGFGGRARRSLHPLADRLRFRTSP